MDKTYRIVDLLIKTFTFIIVIGAVLKITHFPESEKVLKTGIYGAVVLLMYQNIKLKAFVKSMQQSDQR